jgi:hypothetical protein
MDLAGRQTIGDFRKSAVAAVLEEMRGVEQFTATQKTDRASAAIRQLRRLAEATLAQPHFRSAGGALAQSCAGADMRMSGTGHSDVGVDLHEE